MIKITIKLLQVSLFSLKINLFVYEKSENVPLGWRDDYTEISMSTAHSGEIYDGGNEP